MKNKQTRYAYDKFGIPSLDFFLTYNRLIDF